MAETAGVEEAAVASNHQAYEVLKDQYGLESVFLFDPEMRWALKARAGDIVYKCAQYDYDSATKARRETGIPPHFGNERPQRPVSLFHRAVH